MVLLPLMRFLFFLTMLLPCMGCTQPASSSARVRTGAEILLADSLGLLQGKRVALVANHTSLVGDRHLVDTLLSQKIKVVKIFAPEHGFRGQAGAGETIRDGKDRKTGLPLRSLYGNTKTPSAADLANVDIVVFDIQDVGTRFYTYLTTLCLVMQQCAALNKPLVVLDRPNPNGWYTGGPIMESAYTSFIGAHASVPIVHGMTLGEYARMVKGEGWFTPEKPGQEPTPVAYAAWSGLHVIACKGYHHAMRWRDTGLPWVAPSPNLATPEAAHWYPILCWYEATPLSVGRGTDSAFLCVGGPDFKPDTLALCAGVTALPVHFTPRAIPHKSPNPPLQGKTCHGWLLSGEATEGDSLILAGARLLRALWDASPHEGFWNSYAARWTGDTCLQKQLADGYSPERMAAIWHQDGQRFRSTRKKYLIY